MSEKPKHGILFIDQKNVYRNEHQFLICRHAIQNMSGFCTRAWNRLRQRADYKPNKYRDMPDDGSVVVVCPKCKKDVHMTLTCNVE